MNSNSTCKEAATRLNALAGRGAEPGEHRFAPRFDNLAARMSAFDFDAALDILAARQPN